MRKLPPVQNSLDLPDRHQPKPKGARKVAVTSLEAYGRIAGTLGKRLADTAAALQEYITAHGHNPTSWELYNWQEAQGDPRKAFDISGLRSVLTNLRNRGLIYAPNKRQCTFSGETAMVWAPNVDPDGRREILPARRVASENLREVFDATPDPRDLVAYWNKDYPIGTPVWAVINYAEGWRVVWGTTHTEAQVWTGRALVKVHLPHDSVRVCHLRNVRAAAPGEDLPPAPFGDALQDKSPH